MKRFNKTFLVLFCVFSFPFMPLAQQTNAIPGQKIIVEYKENPIVHDYIGTWESEDGNIRFRLEHKVETGETEQFKITSDRLYMHFEKFEYEGQDLKDYWFESTWISNSGSMLAGIEVRDKNQTYKWRLWAFTAGSNKNEFEVTYNPTNAIHPESKDLIHSLKFKVKRVKD